MIRKFSILIILIHILSQLFCIIYADANTPPKPIAKITLQPNERIVATRFSDNNTKVILLSALINDEEVKKSDDYYYPFLDSYGHMYRLYIYDINAGKMEKSFDIHNKEKLLLEDITLSPKGNFYTITKKYSDTLELFDSNTNQLLASLKRDTKFDDTFSYPRKKIVKFSNDDQFLVYESEGKFILYNINNKAIQDEIQIKSHSYINEFCISDTNKYIYYHISEENKIYIYDIQEKNYTSINFYWDHSNFVLSEEYKLLVTTTDNWNEPGLFVFDISTGQRKSVLIAPKIGNSSRYSIERNFQFIPDNKLLVSYSDKTIRTWDLKTYKLIDKYQDTYHIDDHILTKDNNILFAYIRMNTQGKYTYRVIDNNTKKSYATMDPNIVRYIYSTSDDSKMIITGNNFPTYGDMYEVIIWSIQ